METGYTFGNATQETNVDSFVITVNWTQGLNYAGTFIVKKDPLTGVYQVTGNGPSEGPCSGNGVNMHAATTHQGAIYYVYTNFCDNKKVSSSIGNVTIDVPPTNSNGMIFSDGQYIYLNNNSTNFFAYSVAGTQFTFHHILSFNCNAGCAVMCDGSYIFRLCGGTLSKYSLTGTLISSKSATGTGLVNIDATKLFLLNSSFLPTSTTPTFTTTIIMTPISKP